ncbi:MAG: hypothetical protein U5L72_12475 [Bacteroidales bacterium]|nr:hypothetical protein [Bacteroidales bacterium]
MLIAMTPPICSTFIPPALELLDVFNENNVQIMTPAYEDDPEIPKVVPPEQWNPVILPREKQKVVSREQRNNTISLREEQGEK